MYKTIEKRIFSIYSFDEESTNREIERLNKLGKFYFFPKKHKQLNNLYNLEGEPKK